jgi:hypothetical protein
VELPHCVAIIKVKYNEYIESLGLSVKNNPKNFWSFVKCKTGKASIPRVVKWNEECCDNPHEKATMFNEYFHSVFTNSNVESVNRSAEQRQRPDLCHIQITVKDVYTELAKLDTKKAIGPDNISPIFLRECSQELKTSICELINKSLSKGVVPLEWLKSHGHSRF